LQSIVSSATRRVQAVLDVRGLRFGAALLVGLIAWLVFLAQMLMHLPNIQSRHPVPEQALDMKMVVLTAPVDPSRSSAAAQASASPPPPQPARPPLHVEPKQNKATPTKQIQPRKVESQPVATAAPSVPQHAAASASPDQASPSPTASRASDAADAGSRPNENVAGGSAARAIFQPLPDLPDDLREVAYRAEALARFSIHVDGSVDVELVKSTPYPRLNQLLLEALQKWRFFPAMEAGHPVESHQDVRVHFNVS
jgi:protein TonB